MTHDFHPTVLREYDIRGIIGETLGAEDARAIGRGFGSMLAEAGGTKVAVGYDGRVSSPMLEHALVEGLTASGMDAVRIGMSATPMLYYAEASAADVDGGIQITGSHNPANYNGFKMVFQGRPFFGADIQELGRRGAAGEWVDGAGAVEERDVIDAYIDRMLEALDGLDPAALAGLKVGWDAGNGAAGPALEKLAARLPGEHHLLYTEVDGNFPNHHPDPTVEANLEDLRALVAEKSLDFGIAFDGDGDRIGAIDGEGRVIWGDQLLMIYAEDLLARTKGVTIIADVKASRALFDHVADHGGKPLMWKTGHSHMKAKIKETKAAIAGEFSGHICFGERWYGFDDALYTAVRLLELLSATEQNVDEVFAKYPTTFTTPELKILTTETHKFWVMDQLSANADFGNGRLTLIDGIRVDFEDGWGLIRPSNTSPVLSLRFEADTQEALDRIQDEFQAQLANIDDTLKFR